MSMDCVVRSNGYSNLILYCFSVSVSIKEIMTFRRTQNYKRL